MTDNNKTNSGDIEKFLLEKTNKLLELLDQEIKDVSVSQEENLYKIHISADQPGVLIGFRGKTISSLQTLIGLAVMHEFGPETRVLVDINDYRSSQEEKIKNLALEAAQKAKETGQEIVMMPMSPFERRLVHIVLSENEEIETFSEGEGSQRHVIVRVKKD
jgi:spoIIIJ-associated protein